MNLDYRMGGDAISDARVFNKTRIEVSGRNFAETTTEGGMEGAFFSIRTVVSEGDDNGDIYLQGGLVSGGTGNEVIEDIKLYDASSDVWVGDPGDTLIITVTGNGQATSGILDPIFNLTDAVKSIGTVGANTLPTATSTNGKICYLLLGIYFEGGFSPSSPGNFTIGFCWGGYQISRT